MKLLNSEEFENYIRKTYEFVDRKKLPFRFLEISSNCSSCKRDVFLKVHYLDYITPSEISMITPNFYCLFVECPSCKRRSYDQLVGLIVKEEGSSVKRPESEIELYKLYSIPTSEMNFIINNIPVQYESLRNTLSEALFCMTHSKNIAAAILFRRSIQILVKIILKAEGKTLYRQLEWLKTNENALKIDLSEVVHQNADIIKDVGNQGAHPDEDVSLHEFSNSDVNGLHDLYFSIVHEVFVKPMKLKELQEDLISARKLKPKVI